MKYCFLPFVLILAAAAQAMARSPQIDVFDHADANHDGLITLTEFRAARARQFSRFDRNGDGYISQDDVGMVAMVRPDVADRLNQLIRTADANHDGRVSRNEFASAPAPIFERADTNRDGVVDKTELQRLREALRKEQ